MSQEEIELLELEIERRNVCEHLRTFKPNPAQARYLKAFVEEDSRIILFSSANWVGKSAGAIATLAAMMWPTLAEGECFNHRIFKDWASYGYPKRARIISTPKELETIGSIQTEIKKWWPLGRYKFINKGKTYPCEFTTDTGWVVDIMSYEQNPDEFEGATVGLFVFNEPPPEGIYNACLARMKLGGKVILAITPLAGSAWIWDKLVANEGKNGIRVIYGATEEACREHSKNGVIPHQAIQDLANSCDPDDLQARLFGKFIHLAGCIFKGFKREIHRVTFEPSMLQGKDIYMVVDPAIGKPLFVIWAAVGPAGDILIYDEWPNYEFNKAKDPNFGVAEYKEQFAIKESILNGHTITRILDRHFGNARRTMGGLTLKQEFANVGLDFIDSYSIGDIGAEVETGILKVKDALRYNDKKPIDNLNRPKLTVADTCINTIHALERWSRDPKTGKPKEEYKDGADVVRYLVMANPEQYKPVDWDIPILNYGVNIRTP